MQTFLPHADMEASAAVLDSVRLNKQLLEGRQIYKILTTEISELTGRGWVRHPAVLMWAGYEEGLFEYITALRTECERRGIRWEKNWEAVIRMREEYISHSGVVPALLPSWFGDVRVHRSHRFNLYRKDPIFYSEFKNEENVSCCEGCNYFWPTHKV